MIMRHSDFLKENKTQYIPMNSLYFFLLFLVREEKKKVEKAFEKKRQNSFQIYYFKCNIPNSFA